MKTADIVTTQNVVIQYELASVMLRIVATILDAVIVGIYLLICVTIQQSYLAGSYFGGQQMGIGLLFAYLATIPGFMYTFLCEAFLGGRTVGKMAMGTRVINISGANPSIGDYFLRWAFRMVDIQLTLGGWAMLFSMSNVRGPRFGDVVANTMVIKLRPSREYSITDILNIKSKKDYQPTYPQVVSMTDDDMLLIKNSLDRLKKNSNDAHKDLVRKLYDRTVEELGIQEQPDKKVTFLKTVLQDYIVLTRS
jgi:uncharacterized RDD family membrane protein YckC